MKLIEGSWKGCTDAFFLNELLYCIVFYLLYLDFLESIATEYGHAHNWVK